MDRKLGKLRPKLHPDTMALVSYRRHGVLPAAPAAWTLPGVEQITAWGMLGNDRVGDCAVAAPIHMDMAWRATVGQYRTYVDNDALSVYERLSGYDPTTGANDTGLVETDVLDYWRRSSIGDSEIAGWASVSVHDLEEFATGAWLFGGLYIGLDLPLTAQSQHEVWDLVHRGGANTYPGSWGGHAVCVLDRSPNGNFRIVTWGAVMEVTPAFLGAYLSEAYAVVSEDFLSGAAIDYQGIALDSLMTDLGQLPPAHRGLTAA